MNQRNPFVGSHDLHRLYPALGDLAQQSGRKNELAQMLGEETDQSSPVAKLGRQLFQYNRSMRSTSKVT